jgi:hypothetical protein
MTIVPHLETSGHGNASGNGNGSLNNNAILSPSISINLFGQQSTTHVHAPPKNTLNGTTIAFAAGVALLGVAAATVIYKSGDGYKARVEDEPRNRTLAEDVMALPATSYSESV